MLYKEKEEKGPLFKNVAEAWKKEHYKSLSYNTQMGYDKSYKKAVEYFGDQYIKDVAPAEIKVYITNFAQKRYSSKTITHHLSILKMVFTKAIIDGITRVCHLFPL